jgi:hypothetical protein
VPRARLNTPDGKTSEWRSRALRAYQRRTLAGSRIADQTLSALVPILLQKSFCTRDQNFFWLYTRLSCKYVGDLIA